MFVIKKNQVVITALVVMIAAAGYLNYIDSDGTETVMLDDNGEVIEDVYVTDDNPAIADEEAILAEGESEMQTSSSDTASSDEEAGEAVFVNTSNDSSYFIQAKLDREQSRAKQKDMLTEMINNENLEQAKKEDCANEILKLEQRIEKENAAELMMKSKGFDEAYVRMDDETVDVVVNKESLTQAEIAQIEDIVKRKTGASVDKIRISPIKK